jgi:hypothetical protein
MAGTEVYLEVGAKKVFASAADWPGWSRSGKTEDDALEALASYAARYAAVPERAGVRFPKSAADSFVVTEKLKGGPTTDFGAPGEPAAAESKPLTKAQAERLVSIVDACWWVFDRVVAVSPASLRKGPRGGGRDRDKMVDHVLEAENAYLRKIGVRMKTPPYSDTAALTEWRSTGLAVLRAARAPVPELERGKPWPYRYAVRRIAWHVLDHAWEMEDRST